MKETLRWFGPNDSVSLKNISQAGATGVVTSLEHIKTGSVWTLDEIENRKKMIESFGLKWSVVESIPVHNDIKTMSDNCEEYIENYKKSVENVGKSGINLVCYNFMAVLDWTRTNLRYELSNKSLALRFDMHDFAVYDIYILERENAVKDYNKELNYEAEQRYKQFSKQDIQVLEENIIAGLPGGEGSYSRHQILKEIDNFTQQGQEGYRQNLFKFLREIIPVAEASEVKMCIHPDDPPFSLFGLPRVVSNANDVRQLLNAYPSTNNGLTMCVGSFGSTVQNNVLQLIKEFKSYVHFVHLRNVIKEPNGSFFESDHLSGDVDMYNAVKQLMREERHRLDSGTGSEIPMRPDHGHLIGDEIHNDNINPGYSFAGRLKGLSELRGLLYSLS